MAEPRIQLDDQRIDQLVAFCSRLVETHAAGPIEPILFGLVCLAQMAKRSVLIPEPAAPTAQQLFEMIANLRDQMERLNQRLIRMEKK